MLITLSSLADQTTLYSMQRSFPSKVNDKMSFKAVLVRLSGLFTSSCAARALHAIIILRNSFGLKPGQNCVIYSLFFDVCNFKKLQKDVFSNLFRFNKQFITKRKHMIIRIKRRVHQLVTSTNFGFDQYTLSSILLSFARKTVES